MSFGERLQEVRRSNGLTQEQFAEELNVSRQAVSKWESSRGYPEIEKILYICNRYRVPLGELFAEEVPPLEQTERAAEPVEGPPRGNLSSAVSGFLSNLSPKNKWLGLGVLVGIACLAALLALFLKGGTTNVETIIWIIAIVVFGVAEAMTAGLVSIWFVIGSVAGLIAAACGGAVWLQVVLFFVVSIAALLITRPLVKRLSRKETWPPTPTGSWAARPGSRRRSTTPCPPAPCTSTARPGPPAAPTSPSSPWAGWSGWSAWRACGCSWSPRTGDPVTSARGIHISVIL